MHPSLRVLARRTLKRNIWSTRDHCLQVRAYRSSPGQFGEVDRLDFGNLALAEFKSPAAVASVDENHPAGAVVEAEFSAHLADRTGTPDSNYIAFPDAGVDHAMPGGAQYI